MNALANDLSRAAAAARCLQVSPTVDARAGIGHIADMLEDAADRAAALTPSTASRGPRMASQCHDDVMDSYIDAVDDALTISLCCSQLFGAELAL